MIREELELDITRAMSNVDKVGESLERIAATFRRELSLAAQSFNIPADSTVQIRVDADASDITGSIDAAVDNADAAVTVTADAADVTGSIDGAVEAANTATIVTADASDVTGSIDAAVNAASTDISITANIGGELVAEAAGAAAAVDGVGESAQRSTELLDDVGTRGSFSIGKLAAAAAALIGAGFLINGLSNAVQQATNLAESGTKVEAVFKDATPTITAFAENSATSVGLANQQALEFAGTFGNLFTSMGLTTDEAAKLSPAVVTLGADLASFNNIAVPDALEKLRSGLVGEIEPLRALGISFGAVDVQAKAAELGLLGVNGELTEGAKIQARWVLIQERSVNAQGDFARTSDGLANQLRILQAELGGAAAEAGAEFLPTLLQLIDTGRQLIPAIAPIATVFSSALASVAPILDVVSRSVVPILELAGDGITRTFEQAAPILDGVAQILERTLAPVLEELGPSVDVVAEATSALLAATEPLIEDGLKLAEVLGPILAFSLKASADGLALVIGTVSVLIDWLDQLGAFTGPLIGLAEAFGFVDGKSDEAAVGGMKQFSNVSTQLIDDAEALAVALQADVDGFNSYIATQSEFAKGGSEVLNQLRRTGISLDDLHKQLGNGEDGFKQFTAAAVQAGQIEIKVDGVAQTSEQILALDGSLVQFLNSESTAVTRGGELTNAFIAQTAATREQARAQFEAIAAAQGLTDVQIAAIGVQAQQTFGADNYITRLQILAQQQAVNAEAETASAATLQGSASGWVALTQAAANGTLQTGAAAEAAAILGVDMDTATQALADAEAAVNAFVDNALARFPTVTSVYDDLKASTSPVDPLSLTNNLNAATLASLGFQENINSIATSFPEVAKLLQERGPEAAGAFARTFLASSDEVKKGLEQAIVVNKSSLDTIGEDIKASIGTNVATATELAEGMTQALDQNLKFGEVTQASIDEAGQKLTDAAIIDPAKANAKTAGEGIGAELSAGIALGMASGFPLVEQYARDAVTKAEEAARAESESESPSKLFARLGADLGAGVAVGLQDSQSSIVAEAEAIVRAAAAGVGSQPALGIPVAVTASVAIPSAVVAGATAVGSAGTLAPVQSFDVTVALTLTPGVTPEHGRRVGAAIREGILSETLDAEARIV